MIKSELTNKIVESNINNYTQGRKGYKVCKITPHHMAGILSGEQCAKMFQNASRQASANYCIGNDGEIVLSVAEENRAWTSANQENDCQAITIEVSNCENGRDWRISDAAWNSLVKLCVDICKRYGFKLVYDGTKNGSLTRHNMFVATSCPGPYLQGRFQELADTVNAQLGENQVQNTVSNKKRNEEIAQEVIKGLWGNGEDRRNKLTSAGYNYQTIQDIVNSLMNSQKLNTKKDNEQIAQEVLVGDWGNGEERRSRLTAAGYDFDTIQARVNQLCGVKPTISNRNSNETIAREVIQGLWGNGDTRRTKLTQAGYDFNTIQSIVNKLLK